MIVIEIDNDGESDAVGSDMAKQPSDQYSESEAQKRFEAALKAAVNTPPKPLKDVPKKRAKTQGKRKQRAG